MLVIWPSYTRSRHIHSTVGPTLVDIGGVDVFHWNPQRPILPGLAGRILPIRRPVNNFGDLLGPLVVASLRPKTESRRAGTRLLAVGSILHFARDGDTVWGSGVNGKIPIDAIGARRLDVRAVRGPLTAKTLRAVGVRVPDVYGDPGLFAPAVLGISRSERSVGTIVALPNLHDARAWKSWPGFLSPRADYSHVIRTIAQCELVVTSSLHGLVIADALGIPASLVRPSNEALFKYEDYFEGTGRRLPHVSASIDEAQDYRVPPLDWASTALREAFPDDLWFGHRVEGAVA